MRTLQETTLPLQVTVSRRRWLHGEGPETSRLLRARDGKMCCVGFACLAAGMTPEQIKGHSVPRSVCSKNDVPMPAALVLFASRTNTEYALYKTNDIPNLLPMEREADIIRLGLEVGIAFTFED